ncbi:aspartic peptidase domain-containing protein [Lyophyllum atratum]|nr:aspartic peptidase domain-containing protein [Lyophyllum atratum]
MGCGVLLHATVSTGRKEATKELLPFFSAVLVLACSSSALKIPFERAPQPKTLIGISDKSIRTLLANAGDDEDDLGNVSNIRYTTNITINGKEVHVALDTGSTDLWVIPPGGVGQFNDTSIPLELLYGDGTYGVKGTIGVAPFEFGPYKVEKQAFLNAEESTIGAMTDIGIHGLFGLGFDHPEASPINDAIQKKYGPSAKWGASVLQNIFNQNASKPNFVAVDLARTEDLEDTAGGSFNIGEYDEEYVTVASAKKLLQFPRGGTRWTTLLDSILIDGVPVGISSMINGVPAGNAIALIDTGSPTGVFTKDIMEKIFSRISGAVYDPDSEVWIVPCNSTANVELVLGGEAYPVHPLDLTTVNAVTVSGQNYTACTGSFYQKDKLGGDEFDIILGDTFLRNVYAVYDFGDPTGSSAPPKDTAPKDPPDSTPDDGDDGPVSDTEANEDPQGDPNEANIPFLQFLSQTDPAKAAAEHIAIRAKAVAAIGPELPPSELLTLLGAAAAPNKEPPPAASDADASSKTNVNLAGGDKAGTDASGFSHYAPIVIGLLAANLFVGLILILLTVFACLRRGAPKEGKAKSAMYVPVKFKDEDGTVMKYRDADAAYDTPYSRS